MIYDYQNPLYNTVIAFLSIMALIYIYKPDAIYDRAKREFRQFGTDDGKTLMPIYVIAILIAIILYVLFNQIAKLTVSTETLDNSDYRTNSSRLTDQNSELSSLKTQLALMNQNITQLNNAQLNQMNQMNQMSQINQINQQLANMQMSQMNHSIPNHDNSTHGNSNHGISRRDNIRGYDTSGIYRNSSNINKSINRSTITDRSDGSDRSIMSRSTKSVDADNIVNSVLASARPSASYTNSHSRNAIYLDAGVSDSRAILPNNLSI